MKHYENGFNRGSVLKSFLNALRGFRLLLRFEYNLYVQIAFAFVAIFCGFIFSISWGEWAIQTTVIGLVILSELINTAFEKTMDLVHPEYDERVRDIKDLASGTVLFMVLVSICVGLFIYVPKIVMMFS